MTAIWPWVVLFGLGAFHGINPGMGWLFPVFLATTSSDSHTAMSHYHASGSHASHLPVLAGPGFLTAAVVVHTLGHLLVAGLVALLVYGKLGLAILKTAWFNIDFTWALALIATGVILVLM